MPGFCNSRECAVALRSWAGSMRARRQLFASTALAAVCTVLVPQAPLALPTAGSVVDGTANIVYGANSVVIEQGSDRVIIEWESFDIGQLVRS